MKTKVIVTGASGILGSVVYNAFKRDSAFYVLGLAHSRSNNELVKLDLKDEASVERTFAEFEPGWVIHCAAERRPDVAEKNPEETQKLNASVPDYLATLAHPNKLNFKLVYISTDYVFDGTSPPYAPSAQPNPVNLYGRTKRDGESAVLRGVGEGCEGVVLRVPVLYGPAPKNSDTAINILLDVVQDQSGKQYKMDHYATRYPTNVLDIANFLTRLTGLHKPLPPILHFSAPEPFTKYEICLIFSKILSLPHGHIIPDAEAPTGAAAASRPRDCRLDTTETEALLGKPGSLQCVIFEEWWREYLGRPEGEESEGTSKGEAPKA
ncbi:NAD-binding protein [Fomitiporia mediterranea MF3/22]|uniref:NAD-binding protein n=1 Tax=Fomitiporia mediterranea (strain MF3/22) TaxID=694068 RepID=UPI00044093B1|nr:NAD-binding protein [Fomitiporia mediterranea MF3/22]EJC99327.1 NAD-binding protein [Fomitiporia mediterranea MF3/22]